MKIQLEKVVVAKGQSFRYFMPQLKNYFYWHYHPEYELVYVEASNGIRHVGQHISSYVDSDLIMIGQNGLGKSMIAKNICHAAILAGYSVLFRTASDMIEDLQCESATARKRKLRSYGNAGLLCIDEVGYLSYDDNAADLLYEIVNRRYEHRSLIVTTNKGFKQWNEVFPNASCIVTLVDRLTHHADVTKIEGESYRLRESELEAATRRKKK